MLKNTNFRTPPCKNMFIKSKSFYADILVKYFKGGYAKNMLITMEGTVKLFEFK